MNEIVFLGDIYPTDEIYSHTDLDGTERHFNISKIKRNLSKNPGMFPIRELPIDQELVDFCLTNCGVEKRVVEIMSITRMHEPIFIAEFPDDTHMVIDGHHRIVKRWQSNLRTIHAYIISPFWWQNFLVDFKIY